ncbi:MAG: hypothetical protein HYX94_12990 [Chloroflexi bacterium]|nr:hypothetical protein [Chloroflexota bacterium]
MHWSHIAALILTAFACNLILGKWRSYQKKMSAKWFVAIHLSIPLLVFLRLYWQLPNWLIIFTIGTAVLAQFVGGALQVERIPLFRRRV